VEDSEVKPQGTPHHNGPDNAEFHRHAPLGSAERASAERSRAPAVSPRRACLAKAARIKGEISGQEDVFVDGT